jgi:hypothetical protein
MLLSCKDLHLLDSSPHWHLVELTLVEPGTQYVLRCGLESANERLALTKWRQESSDRLAMGLS